MFVICDNILTLQEGLCFRCSFIEAILTFHRLNAKCKSCNIYRDVSSSGNPKNYQYVCTLNNKQLNDLHDKYLS